MSQNNQTSSNFAGPCPRCGGAVPNEKHRGEYLGALSRYDNETYVCSSCGTEEALHQGHLIPFDVSLYGDEAFSIRSAGATHSVHFNHEETDLVCSCGWTTPIGEDPNGDYKQHIIDKGRSVSA